MRLDDVIEFAENPEPRCPCVLLLDTSGSMRGAPIAALNRGLSAFQTDLNRDPLAKKRVEVAVVTFNSEVRVVQDFVTANQFQAPVLKADGMTLTGQGIITAISLVRARKTQYKNNGISYYRPWIFMVTDGAPAGEPPVNIQEAAERIALEEEYRRVAFFAVGVEGADMKILSTLSRRTPLRLKGLQFQEMFLWLSASMQRVSQSQFGEDTALPPPGWGMV
ncbi:MAG: VWA domain-containing protein [Cyanobacteria bacterium P01_H01_bin.15]